MRVYAYLPKALQNKINNISVYCYLTFIFFLKWNKADKFSKTQIL